MGPANCLTYPVMLAKRGEATFVDPLVVVRIIGEFGMSCAEFFHDHQIRTALGGCREVLEVKQQPKLE